MASDAHCNVDESDSSPGECDGVDVLRGALKVFKSGTYAALVYRLLPECWNWRSELPTDGFDAREVAASRLEPWSLLFDNLAEQLLERRPSPKGWRNEAAWCRWATEPILVRTLSEYTLGAKTS